MSHKRKSAKSFKKLFLPELVEIIISVQQPLVVSLIDGGKILYQPHFRNMEMVATP
mgnify:CR=1 FL=1